MNQKISHRCRSFVRRSDRLTPLQKNALETLWPRYGLSVNDGFLSINTPCILEIGFGTGESLLEIAAACPHYHFIGIDVYRPGIGTILTALDRKKYDNVRLYEADAIDVLENCIPEKSLHAIQIFFPDPWPKRRHHKRRLIQIPFLELLASRLKPGGFLQMATDWEDYATHINTTLSAVPAFHRVLAPTHFFEGFITRPSSKFERRGQRLGHAIWDFHCLTLAR